MKKFLLLILFLSCTLFSANQVTPAVSTAISLRLQNNTSNAIITGGWMPKLSMAWANDSNYLVIRDSSGAYHVLLNKNGSINYDSICLKYALKSPRVRCDSVIAVTPYLYLVNGSAVATFDAYGNFTSPNIVCDSLKSKSGAGITVNDSLKCTKSISSDSLSARTGYITGSTGIGATPRSARSLLVFSGVGAGKFVAYPSGDTLPAVEAVSAGRSAIDAGSWTNSSANWIQCWFNNTTRGASDSAYKTGLPGFVVGIRADGKMFLGDSSGLQSRLTVTGGIRSRDSLTADTSRFRASNIDTLTANYSHIYSLPCTTDVAKFKHKVAGTIKYTKVGRIVTLYIPCLKDTANSGSINIEDYIVGGAGLPSPLTGADALFTVMVYDSGSVWAGVLMISSGSGGYVIFAKSDNSYFASTSPSGLGSQLDNVPIVSTGNTRCITVTYIAQ
jgi:hypothetical protein